MLSILVVAQKQPIITNSPPTALMVARQGRKLSRELQLCSPRDTFTVCKSKNNKQLKKNNFVFILILVSNTDAHFKWITALVCQ